MPPVALSTVTGGRFICPVGPLPAPAAWRRPTGLMCDTVPEGTNGSETDRKEIMTPKNKKVSNKFRANLYAFTCIACVLWFAQSYTDFSKAGTLSSAPSIFLLVCIGIVVVYTGVEAIVYWIRPSDKEKAEEQSRDDQDESAADTGTMTNDTDTVPNNTDTVPNKEPRA